MRARDAFDITPQRVYKEQQPSRYYDTQLEALLREDLALSDVQVTYALGHAKRVFGAELSTLYATPTLRKFENMYIALRVFTQAFYDMPEAYTIVESKREVRSEKRSAA